MISYCCRYQECLFSARKVGIIKGLLTGCGTGAMWFGNFSMFGLAIWYGTSLIGSGASGGNVVFVSIKLLLWCPHYCIVPHMILAVVLVSIKWLLWCPQYCYRSSSGTCCPPIHNQLIEVSLEDSYLQRRTCNSLLQLVYQTY